MRALARVALGLSVAILLTGCGAGIEVGHFTVLSTRVYDGAASYRMLGRFRGSSHSAFGSSNIEQAVEEAIRQAPGGIYMTNVIVTYGGFPSGYDVEGDVYGLAPSLQASPAP